MTEQTAFQQLVPEERSEEMLDQLEEIADHDEAGPELLGEQWELSLTFARSDIPSLIEELEEITNDER